MNATMSPEQIKHYPVMLNQILSIISPQHGGVFIDCTFGGGGYSKAILKYPNTMVFGIDRDNLARNHANKLIEKFPKRFSFFQDKFSNLNKFLKSKRHCWTRLTNCTACLAHWIARSFCSGCLLMWWWAGRFWSIPGS